jgi:hypothetical protein
VSGSIIDTEKNLPHAGEARTDLDGLLWIWLVEGQVYRISAAGRSAVKGFQSIPFTARSAERSETAELPTQDIGAPHPVTRRHTAG